MTQPGFEVELEVMEGIEVRLATYPASRSKELFHDLLKFLFFSEQEHLMPMLHLMKMIPNQPTKRKVVNFKEQAIAWTY